MNEKLNEITTRYTALGDREPELIKELGEVNAQLADLNKLREKLASEATEINKERSRLKKEFQELTGRDLRKSLRPATIAAIEQAQGALNLAITAPASLPFTDPVVVKRLAALRDAIEAHRKAKEVAEVLAEPSGRKS